MNAGFGHFVFLCDDDGIVSASASNSKEATASKLSPLEMCPVQAWPFDGVFLTSFDNCRRST
jgi:hypothetical protein